MFNAHQFMHAWSAPSAANKEIRRRQEDLSTKTFPYCQEKTMTMDLAE